MERRVCVLLLICWASLCLAQPTRAKPLSVKYKVTWLTSDGPEIQFLLKNSGGENFGFSFEKLGISGSGGTCDPRFHYNESARLDDMIRTPRREWSIAAGVIPAHGWTHRTISMRGGYARLPCKLSIVIGGSSKETLDKFSADIDVMPPHPVEVSQTSPDKENISIEAMVERDSLKDQVLVRLLLVNKESYPEDVWISDRWLQCAGSGTATWSAILPISPPGDNGPISIEANSWAVLVAPIRLVSGKSIEDCSAKFELSRYRSFPNKNSRWEVFRNFTVALVPIGYFKIAIQ